MSLKILPPYPGLTESIAMRMGAADRAEVLAAGHESPLAGLYASQDASYENYIAVLDGVPVAAFGISTGPSARFDDWRIGLPWLLGNGDYRAWAPLFQANAVAILERWQTLHSRLLVFVHRPHRLSRMWLRTLGFRPTGNIRNDFIEVELSCVNLPPS